MEDARPGGPADVDQERSAAPACARSAPRRYDPEGPRRSDALRRVYTDLDDDELYVAMAGAGLERITRQLPTIAEANAKLAAYHRERRQALATQ